jgi:uncharacterized membrane protein YqgA involved in biofilm formation
MEFLGLGTIINVFAIAIGAGLGVTIGSNVSEKFRDLITDILGFVTLLAAASALTALWSKNYVTALPNGATLLTIMGALLIGGLIGTLLHLEERLDIFAEFLRRKFRASSDSPFSEGFITASLLFAIGPLAILGSISDGMGTGLDQLVLKSTLDFFAAMAFASSLGWGVAASIIPVAIYQGSWTVVGIGLGSVLTDYQISAMTICGGVLLFCIALKLLRIREFAAANLLPSLAVAPFLAYAVHLLN